MGTLPADIKFDASSGVLSGTPTKDGVYTATVQMTYKEQNAETANTGAANGADTGRNKKGGGGRRPESSDSYGAVYVNR